MWAVANLTTVVLSSSDLIRHINPCLKKKLVGSSLYANFFGIVNPWIFMVISVIIIGLALGATDPIERLVELAPNPAFEIILLIFIIIAQITSNLTLNIMPPATAVLIADYYIIRKRKINVDLLYDKEGVYNYVNGFSMAGIITLVVGAVVSFTFLDYSWLVGFPFSVVFYTLLKKSGIEKKFEAEEAALGSEFRSSFHETEPEIG